MPDEESQSDKFKRVARELECDEDEPRWDAIVTKVAAQKPPSEENPA